MSNQVLVALGSNLPNTAGLAPRQICEWAIETITNQPGFEFRAVSRWYRSRAVPVADQPDYVNGVAHFESTADPEALLRSLQAIEAEAGRVRTVPNAARVLDLDLLAVGDRVLQTGSLTLPHPRLHERAFVLLPLCDVAPEWVHPVLQRTASSLCRDVSAEGVERLPT